jgi:hypothetical protein
MTELKITTGTTPDEWIDLIGWDPTNNRVEEDVPIHWTCECAALEDLVQYHGGVSCGTSFRATIDEYQSYNDSFVAAECPNLNRIISAVMIQPDGVRYVIEAVRSRKNGFWVINDKMDY